MTLVPAKKTRAGAPVTVEERIRTAALGAWKAGLSVIPIKADGSKAPPVKWRDFQSRRPTLKEMETLFIEHGQHGLALVCGSVSKNLEALDFESDEAYEMFRNRARDCGLRGLLERLEKAYLEKTPRGVHLLLHSEAVGASTVLARRTGREGSREVLIETRGLELTRFRGHCHAYDMEVSTSYAKDSTTVSTAVQGPDGGLGPCRPHSGRACSGVRTE